MEETELTRAQAIAKADSQAYRRLREKYQQEFNQIKTEVAAQYGVQWSPRLVGKDKARADLARLLKENPDLRTELFREIEEQLVSTQG